VTPRLPPRRLEAKVAEALSKKETLKARAALAQVAPPVAAARLASASELAIPLSHGTPGSALRNMHDILSGLGVFLCFHIVTDDKQPTDTFTSSPRCLTVQ